MIFNVKNELLKNNIKEEKITFELFSSTSSLETENNLNSTNNLCEATIRLKIVQKKLRF